MIGTIVDSENLGLSGLGPEPLRLSGLNLLQGATVWVGGVMRLLKGTRPFLPDSTERVASCTSCVLKCGLSGVELGGGLTRLQVLKNLRSLPNSSKDNHVLLCEHCATWGRRTNYNSPSVNILIAKELGELVMYNLRSCLCTQENAGCCKLASH